MVIDFILAFKELLVQQDEEAFNKFYLETVDIFFRYLKANYFIEEDDMQDIIADFYIKFGLKDLFVALIEGDLEFPDVVFFPVK